jgi:hypothetical protein
MMMLPASAASACQAHAGACRRHGALRASPRPAPNGTANALQYSSNLWAWQRRWQRRRDCHTAVAAATAAGIAADASSNAQLPPWQARDVLRGITADGAEIYLEVVAAQQEGRQLPSAEPPLGTLLAHRGVLYAPSQSARGVLLEPAGWQLTPEDALVRALPGWSAALERERTGAGAEPAAPSSALLLTAVEVASAESMLRTAVATDPSPWRDGTGPHSPPPRGLAYQLLCAGEVESLLTRARGLVMVQLTVGWQQGLAPPVTNPLAAAALSRALSDPNVCVAMSPAPGGLGLTAILAARVSPWRDWAAHLAGFGAQAALVADSPYYKLLIGRCCGYSEDNIRHHILVWAGLDGRRFVAPLPAVFLRQLHCAAAELPAQRCLTRPHCIHITNTDDVGCAAERSCCS